MTTNEKALLMHEKWNGKLETVSKTPVKTREDLAIAYTPGVAEPCKVIAQDKETAYKYTMKANTVAVVSDGSAVLGLGNIGPYAAMPVMEGKAVLFKEFGNVNAVPICLDTQDTEEIIKAVTYLAPGFGGINLEDISAPRCFEIEERLKEILDIPVFHDDQHGTAIVVLAGVINAPNSYNPYRGYDKSTGDNFYQYASERRDETLNLMLKHGYITETEYKLAKSTKLAFQLTGEKKKSSAGSDKYYDYVYEAAKEVQALTGEDPALVPMKIYTSLDIHAQDHVIVTTKNKEIVVTKA